MPKLLSTHETQPAPVPIRVKLAFRAQRWECEVYRGRSPVAYASYTAPAACSLGGLLAFVHAFFGPELDFAKAAP